MSGNKNQKKTEKTNQVVVIYVRSLIEQKKIRITQEEKRSADAIQKTSGNEQGQNPQENPVGRANSPATDAPRRIRNI